MPPNTADNLQMEVQFVIESESLYDRQLSGQTHLQYACTTSPMP